MSGIGSSWGGAVACALIATGAWRGPAVLLCPALRKKDAWASSSAPLDPALSSTVIIAALAKLPPERKRQLLLVHGNADTTVSLDDSRALASATGIALEEIEGGSHGLGSVVRDGRMAEFLQRVCGR